MNLISMDQQMGAQGAVSLLCVQQKTDQAQVVQEARLAEEARIAEEARLAEETSGVD